MKNFKQNGFVLLFAVLLVSIVLTVTLVLLDITLRQLVLSATNRESQRAYYAAHGGIDCAIFWDRDNSTDNDRPLGSYTTLNGSVGPAGDTTITCGNGVDDPADWDNTNKTASINVGFADGSCARVVVIKQIPSATPPNIYGDTTILSFGYNQGDSGACPSVTGNRLVERTLRTTYNDNWK